MRKFSCILICSFCIFVLCVKAIGQDYSAKHFTNKKYFNKSQFYSNSDFQNAKFDSAVYFIGAEFHSVSNFHETQFGFTTDFSESIFDSLVILRAAQFNNSVFFHSTKFHSSVDIELGEFHSAADFAEAIFDSIADFRSAMFDSTADFTVTKFHSKAIFNLVKFYSTVYFLGVEFHSASSFKGVTFGALADFKSVKFQSKADFLFAKFNSYATFSQTCFLGETNFTEVVLPDTLNFSYVTEINKEIDFTDAHLNTTKKTKDNNYKCKIALTGSDISRIKINYELFQLWFSDGTSDEEKLSTYEKLLKKFKDDSFLDSYRILDLEYQNFKNIHNGDIALNWFMKHWWNYDYNKEWVLLWSLGLLSFFTLINIFLFNHLQQKVYGVNFAFYDKRDLQKFNQEINLMSLLKGKEFISFSRYALLKSWKYFALHLVNPLIYTSVLFFGLHIALENFKKFNALTLYVWLMYVAGLFCLAYILNIIIVK